MARNRTTYDTYELHVNYGNGWEHECTEHCREGKIELNRDYLTNCSYPFKWIYKRVPLSTLMPGDWEGIQQDIASSKRNHATLKAQRMAEKALYKATLAAVH